MLFAVYLFLVLVNAGLLAYFLQLPKLQGASAFFGRNVDPGFYQGAGQRILRTYRWLLVAVFLAAEGAAIYATFLDQGPSSMRIGSLLVPRVASMLGISLAAVVAFAALSRQVSAFVLPEDSRRTASSLMPREMKDYTSVPFELLTAALTLAPIVWLAWNYPNLPSSLPWHVNSQGVVDRWLAKSFSALFCIPILVVYAQGWFLLVKHSLVHGALTLPAEHTEEYLRCKEEALSLNVRFCDWLRLLFALPLGFSCLMLVARTGGQVQFWKVAGTIFGLTWGALALLCMHYFGNRLTYVNKRLERETGHTHVQSRGETRHWYAGGLIYFNSDNPAVFVESAVGPSYTLNLGHLGAYIHLAYLGGMALVILWVVRTL